MRKMKKFASILLVVAMMVVMCVPAFAADDDGSITITNAVVGEEYAIYKMLDMTYNASTESYLYTVATGWEAFFATGGAGASYVTIANDGSLTWNSGGSSATFAKLALTYAQDTNNSVTAIATKTATSTDPDAKTTTVKFENLVYGYYLVDSSLGALCALDSTDPDATVTDKNGTPTVDKTVQEDSTGNYGDSNTADIGEVVNFRTEIKNASNVSNLVLHDTMSDGLTLNYKDSEGNITTESTGNTVDITVKVGSSLATANNVVAASNYTVTVNATDGCTFEIAFNDSYTATLTSSQVLVVEYTATVNEDAVIGYTTYDDDDNILTDGNPNETYLKYGNAAESEHDETITYVYDLYVYKYTIKADNQEEDAPLSGAKFVLYKEVNQVNYYAVLDSENKVSSWTIYKTQDDIDAALTAGTITAEEAAVASVATEVSSDTDGLLHIIGLDAGSYYLEETEAPAGYTLLVDPIDIEIAQDGETKADDQYLSTMPVVELVNDEEVEVYYDVVMVYNGSGSKIPSTGGIGTTIFYIVGGVLVCGAAILLITRKRMSED